MKLPRLLPLLLLAACTGDPSGIDSGDVLMTVSVEEDAPSAQYTLHVRVRNQGDVTVYVMNSCGNVVTPGIERRAGAGWVDAPYSVICPAIYAPHIELAPGEAASGAIPIETPGRYRAGVQIVSADDRTVVRKEFTVGS